MMTLMIVYCFVVLPAMGISFLINTTENSLALLKFGAMLEKIEIRLDRFDTKIDKTNERMDSFHGLVDVNFKFLLAEIRKNSEKTESLLEKIDVKIEKISDNQYNIKHQQYIFGAILLAVSGIFQV